MLERRKDLSLPKAGWGPDALEAYSLWVGGEACRGLRGLCDPAETVFIDPS